jgi:hypothetical protein
MRSSTAISALPTRRNEGSLYAEIDRRLALPSNLNKWAYLSFEADENALRVIIKDQGAGFDWRQYLDITPDRATHPNGRGIATSRLMSFSSVEYLGCGNEVLCTVATARHGDRYLYWPRNAGIGE